MVLSWVYFSVGLLPVSAPVFPLLGVDSGVSVGWDVLAGVSIADGESLSSVWFSGLGMVNCFPVSRSCLLFLLHFRPPDSTTYDLGPIDFRRLACDHSISPGRFIRTMFPGSIGDNDFAF